MARTTKTRPDCLTADQWEFMFSDKTKVKFMEHFDLVAYEEGIMGHTPARFYMADGRVLQRSQLLKELGV